MIKGAKNILKWPKANLVMQFCTSSQQIKQEKKKSYVMPEKPQIRHVVYLNRKLKFKNNRYLIYLNKQNLLTPFILDLHYTIPLTYLAYLIAKNPCNAFIYAVYLTFPAALPMMIIAQFITLMFWFRRKSIHKRQIQRIYLLANCKQLQFVYANKIRRFVKNNDKNTIHNIQDLEPKYDHEVKEGRVIAYPSVRFPADPYLPRDKAEMPNVINYGWSFRDKMFNTFMLPAKYDFADWEILTKVINGIQVVSLNTEYEGEEYVQWIFPSIEEEQKNLPELIKSIPQKPQSTTFQQNHAHSKMIFQKGLEEQKLRLSQQQFKINQ